MVLALTLLSAAVAILLPALITGDWHKDRMDRIERGED